jgi:hypothetical protein
MRYTLLKNASLFRKRKIDEIKKNIKMFKKQISISE